MKVLVSAQAPDINAPIDGRFGRAAYFVAVDPESGDWAAHVNPSTTAGGGAGIEAARFAVSEGAGAVITGATGPNAFRTLLAGGLDIYLVSDGSVADAVDAFRRGALECATDASAPAHAGMDVGPAMGRGPGTGSGRGMGGGRGMGRGRGIGGGRGMGRS